MNKASGVDGILVELFQILKDSAVKVLHSICQQIWKTQQWPRDWKMSVFIPIAKKGNAKECSNYCTIALISHTSKVMLKVLQARLQQYVNPHIEPPKQTLGRHKQNLVYSRTQEKGAVTPQETDPDLPVCPGVSGEAQVGRSLLQGWGHCVHQCIMGPCEGGHHHLHYLHHSLASGQRTGREHSPAHQQKIGLKVY